MTGHSLPWIDEGNVSLFLATPDITRRPRSSRHALLSQEAEVSGTIAQVSRRRGRLIVTLFFVVGLMLCHFAEAQTTGNAPVVAPWTYADIGDVGKAGNATQSSSS